jgi:hypothetical protein
MTHGARSYLLTVKGLDSRNLGLLFDIDFLDTALIEIKILNSFKTLFHAHAADIKKNMVHMLKNIYTI